MRRYEDQVQVAVANTFLQYSPSEQFMNRFKELPDEHIGFAELRDLVLGFDAELIKMLEGAARMASSNEVKEAFANLKTAALERQKLTARNADSIEFDM